MVIRSINAGWHVKNLCRFFNSIRNTFEVRDSETVAVVSGKFSGLTFEFETGLCYVSTRNGCTCIDLSGDFTTEALMRVLLKQHIIKDIELDEA